MTVEIEALAQDLLDTMYDLPSHNNVSKVIINRETIDKNSPKLVYIDEKDDIMKSGS